MVGQRVRCKGSSVASSSERTSIRWQDEKGQKSKRKRKRKILQSNPRSRQRSWSSPCFSHPCPSTNRILNPPNSQRSYVRQSSLHLWSNPRARKRECHSQTQFQWRKKSRKKGCHSQLQSAWRKKSRERGCYSHPQSEWRTARSRMANERAFVARLLHPFRRNNVVPLMHSSVHRSIHPYIHPSINPCNHPSIYSSIHLFSLLWFLSLSLSIYTHIYIYMYIYIYI